VIVIHLLQRRELHFSNEALCKNTNVCNFNSLSEFLHAKFDKNTIGIVGINFVITLRGGGEVRGVKNPPWALGTLIYEGVNLERGGGLV
jgi:hypothetical protein